MKIKLHMWHLLLAMTVVAVCFPLCRWLLEIEANDHPNKPHTIADFIGFYTASLMFIVVTLTWFARRRNNRNGADRVS